MAASTPSFTEPGPPTTTIRVRLGRRRSSSAMVGAGRVAAAVRRSGPPSVADSGPATEASNTAADSPLARTAVVDVAATLLATFAATSYRVRPPIRAPRGRVAVLFHPSRAP